MAHTAGRGHSRMSLVFLIFFIFLRFFDFFSYFFRCTSDLPLASKGVRDFVIFRDFLGIFTPPLAFLSLCVGAKTCFYLTFWSRFCVILLRFFEKISHQENDWENVLL